MKNTKDNKIMKYHNMSDFLKGQSSKIITNIYENDEVSLILKNGKPRAMIISNDRFERLTKSGINILEI